MWDVLRSRRFLGIKFRRQVQVNGYIVDFYAPYLRLAIELDGEGHFTEPAQALDRERTQVLESLGVTVIRFENCDVLEGSFVPRLEVVVMELRSRTAFGWKARHMRR